jgi:hypothetical protein
MEGKDRPRPENRGTDPLSLAFRELNGIRQFNRELAQAGITELPLEKEAVDGLRVLMGLAVERAKGDALQGAQPEPQPEPKPAAKPRRERREEEDEVAGNELEVEEDEEPELEGEDKDEEENT